MSLFTWPKAAAGAMWRGWLRAVLRAGSLAPTGVSQGESRRGREGWCRSLGGERPTLCLKLSPRAKCRARQAVLVTCVSQVCLQEGRAAFLMQRGEHEGEAGDGDGAGRMNGSFSLMCRVYGVSAHACIYVCMFQLKGGCVCVGSRISERRRKGTRSGNGGEYEQSTMVCMCMCVCVKIS